MSKKISHYFSPISKRKIIDDVGAETNKRIKIDEPKKQVSDPLLSDIKKDIQNESCKVLKAVTNLSEEVEKFKETDVKAYIKKVFKDGMDKAKFECQICQQQLASPCSAQNHIKNQHYSHFPNSIVQCSICKLRFFQKQVLEIHMKTKHPDGKFLERFECDYCGKVFNRKRDIFYHTKTHLGMVECDICHVELKPSYVRFHLSDFHAKEKSFKCKTCPASFKCNKQLKAHQNSHNKQIECEVCGRKFTILYKLKQHQRETHEKPGSFPCNFCDKKFNNKGNFLKHQKQHDRFRQKDFKCQRCSYATDHIGNFRKHRKYHEQEDAKAALMKNPVKCEECGKFKPNEISLKQHIEYVHQRAHFQCDLCGNYIKQMNTLRIHISKHLSKLKSTAE